ncbi:alpha-L-fucosidase [Streptomyces sp. NPDC050145]|uniref:alpha-L-fucosidase n=1 Tax=Streptomyces sp. NPDC050145 TaxID=3365602 RepID=UPI00378AF725
MTPESHRRPHHWRTLCAALILALAATFLGGAPAARAEVQHPRQEWLRDSTAGLFLHWGMYTTPMHTDCREWERAVTDGGWNADYWVDQARDLGASYIVLATFHSALGYARPWPSKIPGSCATERDLLGELIAAGKAKGVHVILYMTDDPQWHNRFDREALDSAAYSAYKGKDVDLTTRQGFGEYSYDLFHEVMDRYDDLSGFWIDNDNEYWEEHHLYEQVHQQHPSWLLSNNNEDTPEMDTVSNEQKTGMVPSYDYPAAVTVPMPRLTEADYKLPSTGDWWFSGQDSPVDVRLSTGRYITNAGSSIKSLMGETPMVNGRFPAQQEAYNAFMGKWVDPIRESVHGVDGGGYMYGGMQPGLWNDGAHGVVTVSRADGPKTQYVHVVTRPRGDMVRLRDNGYTAQKVTDLRTGKPLAFSQSGGYLSLLGVTDWDQYDTVFKVTTDGTQDYYPADTVKATASSSADGHGANALTDGDFTTYWDNDGKGAATVTLDLGKRRKAVSLAVHQREWSPTGARATFGHQEDSARIKDYRVLASNDGDDWKVVRSGALRSARGVQFIDIGDQQARYLKLDVRSLWGGAQAQAFVDQLKIDEIKVAYDRPAATTTPVPLEAEDAGLGRGALTSACSACSGGARVTGLGHGTGVTFTGVRADAAGDYRLQLDHTSGRSGSLKVSVNGADPVRVPTFAGAPDVPGSSAIPVTLRAGDNTVRVFGSRSGATPGLDRIAVAPMPPSSYTPSTKLTVRPHGLQWVGQGRQSVEVDATLRMEDDEQLDGVTLAPQVPEGWTVEGGAVTTEALRLGRQLHATWTVTSPPGQDVGATDVPVGASFRYLGQDKQVSSPVRIRPLPADRVWAREAEDSANVLGPNVGPAGCAPCSGAEKVRNIGGTPEDSLTFPDVEVAQGGAYSLHLDYTVNGTRSYDISINGGAPVRVTVTDTGNTTPRTTSVPVTLDAGANSIKVFNPVSGGPDLDRLSLSPVPSP